MVGTDGIINKQDNWKDHAKPILFVPDDLRKLRKHIGKCLINSQSQETCVHAWVIFFQAQHLQGWCLREMQASSESEFEKLDPGGP